ncbi:uncharacterized protein LOC111243787 isoform X4 [Varroa destructor]|uniref:RRM domain-containing protein n=2 Tax=Varroa TaxID=62624 RepID=A0A7M7J1Z7_VARDE|nr:uncharacterized protein LOC111243787 isoform X4 [Varroa destructor]
MRYWLGQTIKCRNVLGRTSYDKKNCFGREGKNSLLELSVVSVKKISLGQLIITLATVTATRIGKSSSTRITMYRRSGDMADKESRTVLKDRVFVGKLPRGVSEQDLRRVFSEGGYSVRDIHIQHSARDRDFAFVSFNDERDVEAILETANESPFFISGQNITVSEAFKSNKKTPRPIFNSVSRGVYSVRAAPRDYEPSLGRSLSPHSAGSRASSVSPSPMSPPSPMQRLEGASAYMSADYQQTVVIDNGNHHYYAVPYSNMSYPMTGMFPNGQLVVFPPVTRASMPPYVNHEIWTREALLGYHYGEIPYCGVRGNKGEPLPANPRTDASLLDTIPPEKEPTFPYRFDHYSAPRVDAMPAAITGESVAYAEDEQVAAGVHDM